MYGACALLLCMHVFVGSERPEVQPNKLTAQFKPRPYIYIALSRSAIPRTSTAPAAASRHLAPVRAAAGGTMASANVFNPGGEAQVAESLPFISRRSPVLGTRGMVACSQPLAAEVSMQQEHQISAFNTSPNSNQDESQHSDR